MQTCCLRPTFENWDLYNTPVLLRVDYNTDPATPFKLHASQPTLDILKQKKAKTIIITHRGRPPKEIEPEQLNSTSYIASWLTRRGYRALFCRQLIDIPKLCNSMGGGEFIIVENLRFWHGEKTNDLTFAKQLRSLASYFIQDAWGTVHRNHASMSTLATLYETHHKSIGLVITHELKRLTWIQHHAPQARVLLLGGGKAPTKQAYIPGLLQWADIVLLAPTLSYAFSTTSRQNHETNKLLKKIKEIQDNLHKEIVTPLDYQVSRSHNFAGPYKEYVVEQLDDFSSVTTIGQQTIALYQRILKKAGTILVNGIAGFTQYPKTEQAYKTLLQTVAQSAAYTVVSGGDSVAAVYKYGIKNTINFCSTGGGATLAYLAQEPLPGLEKLC